MGFFRQLIDESRAPQSRIRPRSVQPFEAVRPAVEEGEAAVSETGAKRPSAATPVQSELHGPLAQSEKAQLLGAVPPQREDFRPQPAAAPDQTFEEAPLRVSRRTGPPAAERAFETADATMPAPHSAPRLAPSVPSASALEVSEHRAAAAAARPSAPHAAARTPSPAPLPSFVAAAKTALPAPAALAARSAMPETEQAEAGPSAPPPWQVHALPAMLEAATEHVTAPASNPRAAVRAPLARPMPRVAPVRASPPASPAPAAPTIDIYIGRIDVRAAEAKPVTPRPTRPAPVLPLGAFLKNGGRA